MLFYYLRDFITIQEPSKMDKAILIVLLLLFSVSCQNTEEKTASEKEVVVDSTIVMQNTPPFNAPIIPEKVSFAGEQVPIQDTSILERLDRELLINNFWHTRTMLTIKRSSRWFPLIEKILQEYGVPDDFKYLAVAESGLEQVVSPANAVGFWQFLKKTAKDYDLEVNNTIDERYHVEKSTRAACQYLLKAKKSLGSWTLAAAAYNRGKAGVQNQIEDQGSKNYYDLLLNEETSRYLFRIIATKIIFENATVYGFNIPDDAMYPPYKTKSIIVSETIEDIAAFAKKHQTSYRIIKLLNPWIRKDKITINKEQSYTILVPSKESTLKVHGNE